MANAAEFIESLPHGYDTKIGERGTRLSGGQRQRLAIARALLRDAPVLVLDEATSAIDPKTEASIHQALCRIMKQRTTLVIAHHASSFTDRIDRVVEVKQGKLVEKSTATVPKTRSTVH
jgi:subfamily B ATP-binding cassette protein MsbA/ATP-binding cassette subfamily B protein AbcA/BmrA